MWMEKKAFTEVGSEAPAGGNLLHEGKSNDQYLSLHWRRAEKLYTLHENI